MIFNRGVLRSSAARFDHTRIAAYAILALTLVLRMPPAAFAQDSSADKQDSEKLRGSH